MSGEWLVVTSELPSLGLGLRTARRMLAHLYPGGVLPMAACGWSATEPDLDWRGYPPLAYPVLPSAARLSWRDATDEARCSRCAMHDGWELTAGSYSFRPC